MPYTRHLNKGNLFLLTGVSGFLHELILTDKERPFILAACLAFAGLKWTLPADSSRRKEGEHDDDPR